MDALISLGQLKTRILRSARWARDSYRREFQIFIVKYRFVAYVANVTLMNRTQLLPLFVIVCLFFQTSSANLYPLVNN